MELPKRKTIRLKGYDYSTPGEYFVTICAHNREHIFGEIIVGDGVLDVPRMMLSQYGQIVDKNINQINNYYKHINIDKHVIMPNHIHLIISIIGNGTSRTPSPTNSVIAGIISTFKRFCNKEFGENVWQRSFYDHIIRNENDYRRIWEYIDTNVLNWRMDELL